MSLTVPPRPAKGVTIVGLLGAKFEGELYHASQLMEARLREIERHILAIEAHIGPVAPITGKDD